MLLVTGTPQDYGPEWDASATAYEDGVTSLEQHTVMIFSQTLTRCSPQFVHTYIHTTQSSRNAHCGAIRFESSQ